MIKSVCHEESEQLIGHIPTEISQQISYFLEAATTNTMTAVVTGKRKREIGLVVPAKYVAYTENKKHAQILIKKLLEKQHNIFWNFLFIENSSKCLLYFIFKFFM